MTEYRSAIKRRMAIYMVCTVCALLFVGTAGVYGYLNSIGSDEHMRDFSTGMSTGLFIGMAAVMIRHLVRYRKALNDEAALKAMYVTEHDERWLMIQTKSGGWPLRFVMGVLLLVGIGLVFAGLQEPGFTLLMAAGFAALTMVVLKIFYQKKY